MALSSSFSSFFTSSVVLLSLCFYLFSMIVPCHSQACKNQTFSSGEKFNSCKDLSQLNAQLHWTYLPSNYSLQIGFIAAPTKPEGWIAWGINPNATQMFGTQALIAYKSLNGTVIVNKYNIQNTSVLPSEISFDVEGIKGEASDGVMRIFANFNLSKGMTAINQVWQVGAAMNDSKPLPHEMSSANLKSFETLKLLDESYSKGNVTDTSKGNTTHTTKGNDNVTPKDNGTNQNKNSADMRVQKTEVRIVFWVALFCVFLV